MPWQKQWWKCTRHTQTHSSHQLPGSHRHWVWLFPLALTGRRKQQHCAFSSALHHTHVASWARRWRSHCTRLRSACATLTKPRCMSIKHSKASSVGTCIPRVVYWSNRASSGPGFKNVVDTTALWCSSPAGNARMAQSRLSRGSLDTTSGCLPPQLKRLAQVNVSTVPRSFSALWHVQIASNQKKSRICGSIEIIGTSLSWPTSKALTSCYAVTDLHLLPTKAAPARGKTSAASVGVRTGPEQWRCPGTWARLLRGTIRRGHHCTEPRLVLLSSAQPCQTDYPQTRKNRPMTNALEKASPETL